jgi:predicted lipid-binding transport protein (Tim44 family)
MEKYSAANAAIQNAEKSTSFAAAQTFMNNAQALLKDGQKALDRAMAQQVINEAQTPIDQTDDLITYFKVNRSMGNDPRLAPIIQKRDRAADLLSEANDLLPKNDFSGAKDKALQSSDMATQSYNAALALRKDVGEANPLDSVSKGIGGIFGGAASGLGSILIYIAIIAVIAVVVVIGIILYRRRQSDWDELA